jgi:hypothetical protein
MFQDQMDVGLRLKYLIELKHIRMSYLPEKTNLIMYTHHTFNIILEHCLINCLQCKFSFRGRIFYFINFCEIAFSNNIPNIVVALEVLEHAEVLE